MQCSKDPVKIIHALQFARTLKATALFSEALDAGRRYDREDNDDASDVERDASKDNDRSTIDRHKARADVVGMLLERRLFSAEKLQQTRSWPSTCLRTLVR